MSLKRIPEIICSHYDYDASIDFSNACRSLYIDRARRTEEYRDRIEKCDTCSNKEAERRKSSMEIAMDRLGKEMVRTIYLVFYAIMHFNLCKIT